MTRTPITLTPSEAASIKDLVGRIRAAAPGDLRIYNLCRRVEVILLRANRRRLRTRATTTNRLLTQPEIINEIFKN